MDSTTLGILIDRHAAALALYARQWTAEVDDVVQEAFVKLATERSAPSDVAAWLFKTVRNRAINSGIARRRRLHHEATAAASPPFWFAGEPTRHDLVIDADAAQAALEALPSDQREVIIAHLWGGLTFGQIGAIAGLSTSSTHRLYHAGLQTLRERLGVPCRTTTSRTIPS